MATRGRKVSFIANRVVRKPVRVRFTNRDGELISFKATKKVKVPQRVTFYTKPKNKGYKK